MARPLRIEFAGACYHLINRGNYRRNLFAEGGAAETFERALGEAAERYGWRVHAYVIMRNHFHLAVELTEPNLSEAMRWLQATWARRHNNFRRIIGKPFQGRYKALLVQPGYTLGRVCDYIHLNPARAGVVPLSSLAGYPWSSLPKFARKDCPAWLDGSAVLAGAGGLKDSARGWEKYAAYLEELAGEDATKKELVSSRLSKGWCIGDDDYKEKMRQEARKRGVDLNRERFEGIAGDELLEERHHAWEEKLKAFAAVARINLTELPLKKSSPSKVLLAVAMKMRTSATNQWLGERLKMGEPASVSQFSRRWLIDPQKKSEVERFLSKIKH